MTPSIIQRLINQFLESFMRLQVNVPTTRVEQMAFLVHNAMTGEHRKFHTAHHTLHVCESLDGPIETLAALFHDIIYVQVDHGFPSQLQAFLSQLVEAKAGGWTIRRDVDITNDQVLRLCLDVFDLQVGQTLSPLQGLNEFLSACVAAQELAPYLTVRDLLGVIACIEGTIPFRGVDPQGHAWFDRLGTRLQAINARYRIGLADTDVEKMLTSAVMMANQDVSGFAEEPAQFLDGTWMLLPETNGSLWSVETYSITSYRQAILKTEVFLHSINPQNIFHRYKETPDAETFTLMTRQAEDNICIAKEYLGVKLLAIAVLEALALSTGGDVPLAMFVGDVRSAHENTQRAEDYLPAPDVASDVPHNDVLLSLLGYGRSREISFDMRASPLSYHIYATLGAERGQQLLACAKAMFAGDMTPQDFLDHLGKPLIAEIAQACASLAHTRRTALLALGSAVGGSHDV